MCHTGICMCFMSILCICFLNGVLYGSHFTTWIIASILWRYGNTPDFQGARRQKRVSWHLSWIKNPYWLIYSSEASVVLSKCEQKFIRFVFVFSCSRACLCPVHHVLEADLQERQMKTVPGVVLTPRLTSFRRRRRRIPNFSSLIFFRLGWKSSRVGENHVTGFQQESTAGHVLWLWLWCLYVWPWSSPASKVTHNQPEMGFISMSAYFSWTHFSLFYQIVC